MADKKVSMKELRDVLERFIKDFEGAEVIRLDADQEPAGQMAALEVKKALDSLKAASSAASEICRQPVLAVVLRKP